MLIIPLIILLVVLASFVLWIFALVDVVRRQFSDSNTKLIWVLVIVFAHGIGAIVYLAVGRQQGSLPS